MPGENRAFIDIQVRTKQLVSLHNNLNTLLERQAKYGDDAPQKLLDQIQQHRQAIDTIAQTVGGRLSEAELIEALKPLPLAFYNGQVVDIEVETYFVADELLADRLDHAKISQNIDNLTQQVRAEAEKADRAGDVAGRRLAEGLTAYAGRLTAMAEAMTTADMGGPYRGLLPYRFGDTELFYGREEAIAELLAVMNGNRLTILHAEPGVGKSSLLQAGLAPRLLAQKQPYLPIYLRPYDVPPALSLKYTLLPTLDETPELLDLPLRDFLRRVSMVWGRQVKLYLLLDQFEELFTLLGAADRAAFAADLAECLKDRSLPVYWLLTLRSDFFGELANFRPAIKNPFANEYRLNRLTSAEATTALVAPAARQGLTLEVALVETLLPDLRNGQERINPIHLQLVCSTLYDLLVARCQADPDLPFRLSQKLYEQEGRAEGILRGYLPQLLSRHFSNPLERDLARQLLAGLVSAGRRIRRSRSELAELLFNDMTPDMTPSGQEDERRLKLNALLEQLLKSRLLVVTQDQAAAEPSYELAHDYLLAEIEIDPDLQARRTAQELLDQAVETYGRSQTLLSEDKFNLIYSQREFLRLNETAETLLRLSGERLKIVQQRDLEQQQALAEAQREQAEARREEAEAQSLALAHLRKRLTWAISLAVVGLILALLVGVLWLQSNQQVAAAEIQINRANLESTVAAANEKSAREERDAAASLQATAEVAGAAAAEQEQLALAAEASAEAARVAAQRQARLARAGQLALESQLAQTDRPQQSLLLAVESLLATQADDPYRTDPSQALREAVQKPLSLALGGHQARVGSLAFSPDGQWLVTGSLDGTARLWSIGLPEIQPRILQGHKDGVWAVAFSPDGQWLATGGLDGMAYLWSMAEPGAAPRVLQGHQESILSLAFSPDSRWLATGSADNTIRLWSIEAPEAEAWLLQGHTAEVGTVAFSPDGQRLASGSFDNTARLWSVEEPGSVLRILQGHTDIVWEVAFSPDGEWLATGGRDGVARLWSIDEPGAPPRPLQGHASWIVDLAFSPDSQWLATGSADSTARVWSLVESQAEPRLLQGHTAGIIAVAFSPASSAEDAGGHWLATASIDGTARLWSMDTLGAAPRILQGHEQGLWAMSFSPDGQWLATGSEDATARLWPVEVPETEPRLLQGHQSWVMGVAFSPDSQWLASASLDSTARLWAIQDAELKPQVLQGHEAGIVTVAFNVDGQQLATGSIDGAIRLWQTDAPQAEPQVLLGHEGVVVDVAYSPAGGWLASGGLDNTVRLWSLETPEAAPRVLQGHSGVVVALAFDPKGQWLASGSADGTARLWPVAEPEAEPRILQGHQARIVTVAFSPGGQWLATGSLDGTVRLWPVNTPTAPPRVLQGHRAGVEALAFSPNGQWLASGSLDGTVRLWRLDVLEVGAQVLEGHTAAIRAVAFSPDGQWLASGSEDKTARLWRMDAPRAGAQVLQGHEAEVRAVAFSPDGQWLATGSLDGAIRLWRMNLTELVTLACDAAQRNLTMAEWQRYFPGELYRPTCSNLPVHASVIRSSLDEGRALAQAGDVDTAIAVFEAVQTFDPAAVSAADWNILCRFGSLWGQGAKVEQACEQAINLASQAEAAVFQDSRGINRASLGDYEGAIEDFQAFITWLKANGGYDQLGAEREAWIETLQAGQNPFEAGPAGDGQGN
jgi:WD40 repeat protein